MGWVMGVGAVIEVDPGRFRADGQKAGAAPRPPRRVSDPRERAPIVLDQRAEGVGSALVLAGEPAQASVMRHHLRLIAGTRRREFPTVESLASELFNNAITHSRSGDTGGEVTVAVVKLPDRVQVKVTDQGPREGRAQCPHLRPQAPDAQGGFGLRMVDAQASRWGTVHEAGRTTVWFEVDRPERTS
ncbi:ATP-binding protein [Nocardiopsis sp. NPDC006198]|uniref:ATP-binding protein n=1 Tax=Nocardiopsis sp. NPDC006198 TaxID=3154472 RepID=UPI0033B032CF